jgi:hypothetical protein
MNANVATISPCQKAYKQTDQNSTRYQSAVSITKKREWETPSQSFETTFEKLSYTHRVEPMHVVCDVIPPPISLYTEPSTKSRKRAGIALSFASEYYILLVIMLKMTG